MSKGDCCASPHDDECTVPAAGGCDVCQCICHDDVHGAWFVCVCDHDAVPLDDDDETPEGWCIACDEWYAEAEREEWNRLTRMWNPELML